MKNLSKLFSKFRNDETSKALRTQRIITIVIIVLVIAAVLFSYIKYSDFFYETFTNKENLEKFLSQFGGFDKVVFVAIRAFQTVVKVIPAEPLEIGAGAFYGTIGGMLLCMLGSLIGSIVIILITKKIGVKVVNLFVPVSVINDFEFFKDKKRMYTTLFFIYLIPSSPKDLLVYAASLTEINVTKFLIVTTVARIPNIILSTWCGSEFISGNYQMAITIFGIMVLLAICLSFIYKKFLHKKRV